MTQIVIPENTFVPRPESASERAALIEELKTWLGTKFHHAACVKGQGVDCALILLAIFSACGLIPSDYTPAYYSQDFMLHRSEEIYLTIIRKFSHEIPGPPKPADVALYKFGRVFSHSVIVVDWPVCIHAATNQSVQYVDVSKESALWKRPVKFFSVWE